MFTLEQTAFRGLQIVRPRIFSDHRGTFVKTFHRELFEELGVVFSPREEFFSISHKGVIRGMHFQLPPEDHDKLVYCTHGSARDVILDLRKSEPTFGKCLSFTLSAENRYMLFIPTGCAHGFASLEDHTLMMYHTSTVHSAKADAGIKWDSIGFDWGAADPIVSERDQKLPKLEDFQSPF